MSISGRGWGFTHHFRGVIANHQFFVHIPTVGDFTRIRIGSTGQRYIGTLQQSATAGRRQTANNTDRYLRCVLDFQLQLGRSVCPVGRVLGLAGERRVVVLLFGRQLENGFGGEATRIGERFFHVIDAAGEDVAVTVDPGYLEL